MKKPIGYVVAVGILLLFFSANAWATSRVDVPDGGSSALLLGLAAVGLGVARRFLHLNMGNR